MYGVVEGGRALRPKKGASVPIEPRTTLKVDKEVGEDASWIEMESEEVFRDWEEEEAPLII